MLMAKVWRKSFYEIANSLRAYRLSWMVSEFETGSDVTECCVKNLKYDSTFLPSAEYF
jgi:hypothetical protein